jgi:hypothetical protein
LLTWWEYCSVPHVDVERYRPEFTSTQLAQQLLF